MFIILISILTSIMAQAQLVQNRSVTSIKMHQSSGNSATLRNLGLSATVNSNALTIALKQADGSTNATASAPVDIAFRSSTLTNGLYVIRSATGSLSVVVSSGSTLGQMSGVAGNVYVYAIDNAGTVELAVSSRLFEDESGVISTTAEGGAGAADSSDVMYSTTARSNVAFRLLGKVTSTQGTAGTWATSPSAISLAPLEKKHLKAGWVGSSVWAGASSCLRAVTSSTYVDVPTDSDCNNPTLSGQLQALAAKTISLNKPIWNPGLYEITQHFQYYNFNTGAETFCRWTDSSGTYFSDEFEYVTRDGSTSEINTSMVFHFLVTVAFTGEIKLQCKVTGGTLNFANLTASDIGNTATINVKYFPLAEQ